jgi:hypothetical protein
MKRPEERTGGPEAASPLRRAIPHGQASPSSFPEARSVRFRRLDDPPPKLRSTYPESFFYSAPAHRGDRRWASSLVAAMLSLTLASSMIALALLGGTVAPGALSTGPRQLPSDTQAPTVRVRTIAPSELAAPGQNAAPATGAEASTPTPLAASGSAPAAAPPAPPAATEAVADGGTAVEGFEQGTAGTGQGGGGDEGGQVPPPGEGGIVGGGGIGIDAGEPPPPPPTDTDDDPDEGEDDPDDGDSDGDEGEDSDGDDGEDDPDEGEDDPDDGDSDGDEGEDDTDEGEELDQEMPPAVAGSREPDAEAADLEED